VFQPIHSLSQPALFANDPANTAGMTNPDSQ
jgi:hypothetical protein